MQVDDNIQDAGAKKNTIYIFQSVTYPQLIKDQNCEVEKLDQKYGSSSLKKNKHGKYVLHILFYQRTEGSGDTPSWYTLKRRKLIIGNADVTDYADGINNVHPMIVKAMKTRYKNLLISSPSFNYQNFKDAGEFLSKKFWQVNLLWGESDQLADNFRDLVTFTRSRYSQITVSGEKKNKKVPLTGTPALPKKLYTKKVPVKIEGVTPTQNEGVVVLDGGMIDSTLI